MEEEEAKSGLEVREEAGEIEAPEEGEELKRFKQVASKRRWRTALGAILLGFAFFLYALVLLALAGLLLIGGYVVLALVIIASVCIAIGLYSILYFPPVEL